METRSGARGLFTCDLRNCFRCAGRDKNSRHTEGKRGLESADRAYKIAHRANAASVARVREAAEAPVVLDCRHHRVVIGRIPGTPRKSLRPGNDHRHHVPPAGIRVTASTGLAESSVAPARAIPSPTANETNLISPPRRHRPNR